MRWALSIAVCILSLAGASAFAADPTGTVERVQGTASGTLEDGSTHDLAAGVDVYLNEAISTGADARLAVTLSDGTRLTLGENAKLILDTFIFSPAGNNILRASVTGAFRYISGALEAGATRDATVVTPAASIGIRGTDFWGGPIDGNFGVVVLEGSVSVTTPAGTTVLDAPGEGTTVTAPEAAPGPVVNWAQAKIDRAIASVTFR